MQVGMVMLVGDLLASSCDQLGQPTHLQLMFTAVHISLLEVLLINFRDYLSEKVLATYLQSTTINALLTDSRVIHKLPGRCIG